jgi:hypothetical protein
MARRFAFVFYVVAGPVQSLNTAYWGPPVRVGTPQRALSVDLGVETNVQQVSFRGDGMAPVRVVGKVQDRMNNRVSDVRSTASTRPALAARPDWQGTNVRTRIFRDSGVTTSQAQAWAQGTADASTDSLTATGTLDGLEYGALLTARGLVGLRGAGQQHDGLYYVKQVTHSIGRETYTQSFVLTREGTGTTTTAVPV